MMRWSCLVFLGYEKFSFQAVFRITSSGHMIILLSILSLVACQELSEARVGCCLQDIIGEVLVRALHTSSLEHSKVLKIPTSRANAFSCSNVNSLKRYHNKPLSVISNSAWIGVWNLFSDGHEVRIQPRSFHWSGLWVRLLRLGEVKSGEVHFPPPSSLTRSFLGGRKSWG